MSYTELFRLGHEPESIGRIQNAWLSAIYVWDDIADKYFGTKSFLRLDAPMRTKIWNANKHVPSMPEFEKIVLQSTMDNAIVFGVDIPRLAEAFEQYGAIHPNSSYAKQAAILRSTEFLPDDAVAWNQTSVGKFWGLERTDLEDEDGEQEESFYDIKAGTKHFDVFEELGLKMAP